MEITLRPRRRIEITDYEKKAKRPTNYFLRTKGTDEYLHEGLIVKNTAIDAMVFTKQECLELIKNQKVEFEYVKCSAVPNILK